MEWMFKMSNNLKFSFSNLLRGVDSPDKSGLEDGVCSFINFAQHYTPLNLSGFYSQKMWILI